MSFGSGNVKAAHEKILEYIGPSLSDTDKRALDRVALYCVNPRTAASKYKPEDLAVLERVVRELPVDKRFPALDMLRLLT